MEILLNELSLEGQFACVADFKKAIHNVMTIKKLKSELHCHRNLREGKVLVTRDLSLQQAVKQLDINLQRAFMSWITTKGPFWEDKRQHGNDLLKSQDEIVTNTGLGEVAYRCFKGSNYQTFSFEFSKWQINPITVNWYSENKIQSIDIINHWRINDTLLDNLLNDYQHDESNIPSLNKPFPNLEWSDKLVDLNKFREEFSKYPSDKQAIIQPVADRIAKINGYKFNQSLSTLNQQSNKKKSHRKIYEANRDRNKVYLSVDFEKGAFELCNHAGEHQGEYKFNGEKSGEAKLDHSILLIL